VVSRPILVEAADACRDRQGLSIYGKPYLAP
jgi:hypothetical protein